ncbi:hypothetical protein PG991_007537 [Apiospora marii]|uniref:Uncharacterized protein n=1 Tax=Apiospora marii TaxID=335849 RepID=A0ABR1RTW8_9PEZI
MDAGNETGYEVGGLRPPTAETPAVDGAPWNVRGVQPTRPNVKDVIEGKELPDILYGATWVDKATKDNPKERVLKPDARVPVIAQQKTAPDHASQPLLASGIKFFKSYDLPSEVEDDLKLIIKALAPTDILEPFGLMKLALLNWWTDSPADKISDYLVYFKTMVLYVLRINLAAFPTTPVFMKA